MPTSNPVYPSYMTVADYIERLKEFPPDWRVIVSTPAGGGVAVEHREIRGEPVVAIFGSNGGRFGENPLTEEEYAEKSKRFMEDLNSPDREYTSIHGDHRMFSPKLGDQATCYGTHYDRRIIERMVDEGLIPKNIVDLGRVAYLDK